jgi:hypothetical protein
VGTDATDCEDANGGAIYAENGANVEIHDTIFQSNTASYEGQDIYQYQSSVIFKGCVEGQPTNVQMTSSESLPSGLPERCPTGAPTSAPTDTPDVEVSAASIAGPPGRFVAAVVAAAAAVCGYP